MSQENFLWGAPRIHGELLKLGFDVSQATVSRQIAHEPRRRQRKTVAGLTMIRLRCQFAHQRDRNIQNSRSLGRKH